MRDELLEKLAGVVHELNNAGDSWWPGEEIGRVAIRRWRSFSRRSKVKKPTRNHRLDDLVKGLKAHFEPDTPYTHPDDWRALAEALARVLEKECA